MQRWLVVMIPTAALVAPACGGHSARPPDDAAGTDSGIIDDADTTGDSGPRLTWVELTIAGCAADPGSETLGRQAHSIIADAAPEDGGVTRQCTGQAPLALEFTALASGPVANYDWDFGDSTRSREASPVHVYELPGLYSVRLTAGGPGGTAEIAKLDVVSVGPASLGSRCTVDAQCMGQKCICGDGVACRTGLERGICSAPCSTAAPCGEGVCADLAAGNPSAPEDWQRSLCLLPCPASGSCPGELACQELPSASGPGWLRACFAPGIVRAMGESCVDALGNPDHALCASGLCASIGARGVCSAACAGGDCPPSAACGNFVGPAPSLCLRRCDAMSVCTGDPWLACELAGGTGTLDFTVDEPAFASGYCAPRSCTVAGECGPDGQCASGFCQPR